jgi:hypothetical protein
MPTLIAKYNMAYKDPIMVTVVASNDRGDSVPSVVNSI